MFSCFRRLPVYASLDESLLNIRRTIHVKSGDLWSKDEFVCEAYSVRFVLLCSQRGVGLIPDIAAVKRVYEVVVD